MTLRNPRYTGENRCWPCTVVNVSAVAAVAGGLFLLGYEVAAAAVGAVGIAATWTRGYVAPGTPQLTRHLPEPVLRGFGKKVQTTPPRPPEDVARAVSEAGLVIDGDDGSLRLADDVRSTYEERAREFASDRDRLEALVRETFLEVEELSVNRGLGGTERWFARDGNSNVVEQWDARAVVAMDVAGTELLADRVDGWRRYPPRKRRQALAVLRRGAKHCPTCRAAFETNDGPTAVCCDGRSIVGTLRCADCGYAVVDANDLPSGRPTPGPTGTRR